MGCDIHICLETRNRDGEWVNADLYKINHNYGKYEEETELYTKVDCYQGRDYRMFTALCGVRDYSDNNAKISEPKGIPKDACQQTKREVIEWGTDGHSHSWNTLTELYAFKLNNTIVKESGLISQKQADKLDNEGVLPTAWCQWSSAGNLVYREWKREYSPLDNLIESIENQLDKLYFFNYKENSDKVRIVYWFDN